MTTVAELRQRARTLGIPNRSNMTKAALEAALSPVTIYRQDRKVMTHLRKSVGKEPWLQFDVAEWESRGSGRFFPSRPRAWNVPSGLLAGITPMGGSDADMLRERRSEAGRKAQTQTEMRRVERKRKFESECVEAAQRIGAFGDSRAAAWLVTGQIDEREAKLIAFRNRIRHEYTDYDARLASGEDKESARALATQIDQPTTWEDYLQSYGLAKSEVAVALASVLRSPREAHPAWFYEAVLAVERDGLDTASLTYEMVSEAIGRWRDYRAARREWD